MEVICLEEKAFYELVQTVLDKVQTNTPQSQNKWLNTDEAMSVLGIKSKTTLQKLRDEGEIRFSQPKKKLILYDRESLESYLDKHAQNPY